jgi:signal recognition particle GTPase
LWCKIDLREVRRALLEADVALEVVRAFHRQVREKAVGAESSSRQAGPDGGQDRP